MRRIGFLVALAATLALLPTEAMALPIVLAVAGSLVTSAIGGFAAGWGISLAISVLSAGLKMAMSGKQKSPEFTPFTQHASDRTHMVRSSIQAHRWIYGTAKVSGPMVAAFSTEAKLMLHLVLPLAGHQVARFQEIFINDTLSTDARFMIGSPVPFLAHRLKTIAGTCGQAADSDLVAEVTDWTSAHRLRGLAYLYAKLRVSTEAFPTGIPNLAVVVDGRMVYDPRLTGVTVLTSSAASPAVFTTSGAHGLAVGDRVWLRDHAGAVPVLPASYDGPHPAIAKEFEVASVPTSATLTLADPYRRSDAYGADNFVALATGGTGGTLTRMKWTNNAALCIADYHWAPVGGNCDIDEVDEAVLIESANVCDEYVTVTSDAQTFTADATTDEITLASGEWETGDRLQVSTTGGLPAGLSGATTVQFDAFSEAAAGTGALSWTHTPVGTPRGVWVAIVQDGDADRVTAVTYGGVALARVQSPSKASGEPGRVYGYFLGAGIPTGAQTVSVTITGGVNKRAACYTLTASGDTEIVDSDISITSDAQADPSAVLSLSGRDCWCSIAFWSGLATAASVTPLSGWSSDLEHDFTSQIGGWYKYDTVGTADVTAGWTQASDDALALAVAIGATSATNYYWIRTGAGTGKLATTLALARLFTGINLTTAGTGTHTATKNAQLRYTMNGTFDLDAVPPGVVEDMLTAMMGARPYAQGSYRIIAGAYETPTRTITIDNLAADIDVEPFTKRAQLYNAVRGTFVDPSQLWVPTEFPLLTDGVYEGQDGGERIYRDIELPFTTDSTRAQRLAMIALLKSRQAVTAILPCNWSALDIGLWDTINVTIAQLGWSSKVFRVTDIGYPDEGGVTLTVQEEASTSYSWSAGDVTDYDPAPNTSLPDPWTAEPPTGLTLDSGEAHMFVSADGTVHSRIYASWTEPGDAFVASGGGVEVRFKPTTGSTWKMVGVPGDDTDAYLDPVEDGVEYQVQIRSVNSLGVQSDWVPEPTATHTVVGKTAAPPDVLTFSVTRMADGTRRFAWTNDEPLPADVRSGGGFLIRYALGTGLAWGALTPLHTGRRIASPFETNDLAAGIYTFGIKMVDTSGNESANAAIIEATLGDPRLREVLLSQSERTLGWPGTIVDAFINPENYLEATGAQTWNDLPATWALLAATWAGIVTNDSPITYTTQQIDIGVDVSFTPLVSVEGLGSMTITMQLGTTADGAVTGAFVPIGPVTAKRYIKIKVEVAGTTPLLRELVTLVDAALQIEDYEDIDTSAASAGRVERIATGHFKIATRGDTAAISQAQVTAFQNAGSGWTWELLSKSTTITGDPEPAAEFKIYKSLVLTDALIDAEIKGLKLS